MIAPLFGSITRPLLSPLVSGLRDELFGAFTPRSLFNDGSIGVLYDNNDLTSFYLDAAGTTPATVNGLVGLQLDKSQGLVLGAELVANGGFDSDTAWTKGAGWAIADGKASFTGTSAGLQQPISLKIGAFYKITITATYTGTVNGGSLMYFRFLNSASNYLNFTGSQPNVPVTVTGYIRAAATDATLDIVALSGFVGSVDNVSLKELPGNHRYQTTTGSKPILRGTPTGANLVTNGDFASATGWTLASGCSITGGALVCATASPGTSFRSITTNASSRTFLTDFTISGRTSGDVVLRLYKDGVNVTTSSTYRAANGRYVAYVTTSDQPNRVVLEIGGGGLNASIDDVAVYDVSAGSVTAPYGLQYDGVDDFLQTASVNFSATDKMFVCAGVRKLSGSSAQALVELSASSANIGAFGLFAPWGSTGTEYGFLLTGTTPTRYTADVYTPPTTNVLSCRYDISGAGIATETFPRINGAIPTLTAGGSADAGTGNFGNYPFYFGRRGGTTFPFNGLDFGFCIVGKTLTASQIANTERWMAQRTGVTL